MLSTPKGKINLLNMLTDTLIYLDACMGHAEEHGRKHGGNKLLRYPRSLIFSFVICHFRQICFGTTRYTLHYAIESPEGKERRPSTANALDKNSLKNKCTNLNRAERSLDSNKWGMTRRLMISQATGNGPVSLGD